MGLGVGPGHGMALWWWAVVGSDGGEPGTGKEREEGDGEWVRGWREWHVCMEPRCILGRQCTAAGRGRLAGNGGNWAGSRSHVCLGHKP